MNASKLVPVHVLRGCVASGKTLIAGTGTQEDPVKIRYSDYKVLSQLKKVELLPAALKPEGLDDDPEPDETAIDVLELAEGPEQALKDAGLDTLTAAAEYVLSGKDLTEISGVGKGTAEKVLAALEAAGLLKAEE